PVAPVAPVAPVGPVGPVGPVAPVEPVAPVAPTGPVGPVAPTSPVRSNVKVIGSLLANGLAAELSTFDTVTFLYPVGDATAETVNTSHFVGSVVLNKRRWPFTVFVEFANEAR